MNQLLTKVYCRELQVASARGLSTSLHLAVLLVLVEVTLSARETTPHPFGGLIKAGIVVLAGKVP